MTSRASLTFVVLTLSMLVYSMQFSTVAVALPDLLDDLDAPLRWGGWVLSAFFIGQVVALPVAGRVVDRVGRWAMFQGGLLAFTGASLAAAVAPDISVVILARTVQGVAGGAMMPASTGIISDAFGEQRARPIGLITAVLPVGTIIGPVLGGLLVEELSWRSTFAINVPFSIAGMVATAMLIPRDPPRTGERLNLGSIVLLFVAVTSLVLALTELGRREAVPQPLLVGPALAISVVAAILLVRGEMRARTPLIELDLLAQRPFAAANALAFLYGAVIFSIASFMPVYAQLGYDLSAATSGAIVAPRAITVVLTSAVAALVIPRTGYRRPLLIGLLGLSGALIVLALGLEDPSIAGVSVSSVVWLSLLAGISGVWIGMINPALNNANLHMMPDRIPAIVGLRGMFQFLGGTVGIAVVVLIASRADSEAAGFEIGFVGLALLLIAGSFLVPMIPDLGSGTPRPVDRSSDITGDAATREP